MQGQQSVLADAPSPDSASAARPVAMGQAACRSSRCRRSDSSTGDALAARLSSADSVVNRRSEIWSVRMRLISSGIVRSKLRSPASTCATRTPSLAATSAQAIVELTSPTTSTRSVGCSMSDRLERRHDRGGLLRVRAGADFRLMSGRGHAQIVERRPATSSRRSAGPCAQGSRKSLRRAPQARATIGATFMKFGRAPTI